MKYSYKVSDAIHILAYVSIVPAGNLSSNTIAESIESNASVVRRLMSNLKNAGLLASTVGAAKPRLAKPASEITLLDVCHQLKKDLSRNAIRRLIESGAVQINGEKKMDAFDDFELKTETKIKIGKRDFFELK